MNACVIKPQLPFVTKRILARTPASEDTIKIAEFIDSHDFSFDVNRKTNELTCNVRKK